MTCRVLHDEVTTDLNRCATMVVFSSFLFLTAIDIFMRTVRHGKKNCKHWTLRKQPDDHDLADYLVIVCHNQNQMQEKTSLFETMLPKSVLFVKRNRTNAMKINTRKNSPIVIQEVLDDVQKFAYLVSIVVIDEGTDLRATIGKALTTLIILNNIWNSI